MDCKLMRLAVPLLLCLPLCAATGDITAVRVLGSTCTAGATCNGWTAEVDISGLAAGGAYATGITATSVAAAKMVFSVSSAGDDTSGGATTTTRTVYGKNALRKPSPDQATNDETAGATLTIRVALSDPIYASDTLTVTVASGFYTASGTPNNAISGLTVTNGSTVSYPKTILRWATVPYQLVSGDFVLEAVAFNRFARSGKPVAATVFACSDAHAHGSGNIIVTQMTKSALDQAGMPRVLVYAATIPASSFTPGDALTCNVKAYPWVGDSGSVADSSGGPTATEVLGPLPLLYATSYGRPAAVVDAVNGQASTAATWVYATQAAAETAYGTATNSYQTISHAAQACKSYNNANNGHADVGGCIILIGSATTAYPGTTLSDLGAQKTWLTLTRLSTVPRASAILTGSTTTGGIQLMRLEDITISTADATHYIKGSTTLNRLWVSNATINASGDVIWFGAVAACATNNTIAALKQGFGSYSSTKSPFALVRGNSYSSASPNGGTLAEMYAVLGNRGLATGSTMFRETGNNAASTAQSDNSLWAYNTLYNFNVANTALKGAMVQDLTTGIAIVQNVFERSSGTNPLLQISADAATANTANVIIWHNTFAGERANLAYNDGGTAGTAGACAGYVLHSNWSVVGNIFSNLNVKADTYQNANCHSIGTSGPTGENAARVGNWSAMNGVGWAGNLTKAWAASGVYFAPDSQGLYGLTTAALGWVSDKSVGTGTGVGNGDYHLTAASGLKGVIPPTAIPLPFDLDGVARSSGAIGAYEYPLPTGGIPAPVLW